MQWNAEANRLRKLSKSRIVSCSRNVKLSDREKPRYKLVNPSIEKPKLADYITQIVNIHILNEKSVFIATEEFGIITIDFVDTTSNLLKLFHAENMELIYKRIAELNSEN
jgi:hypothetical protein